MLPKLKISAFLLKRLERVKQQCSGCLFGVFYGESTLLLMGFNMETTIGQLNYEQIQHKFPAELDLCGLVKFGDCSDAEAHLTEILKDVDITDNPILMHCELGTLVGLRASIFMHGKLQEVPYEVMEAEQLTRDFCFTRLKCSLNLYTEQTSQAVKREMHAMRKTLSAGSLAFRVVPTRVYITNASAHGISRSGAPPTQRISNNSLISDVVSAAAEALGGGNGNGNKENIAAAKPKKKDNNAGGATWSAARTVLGCDYEVLDIDVLRCKTRERVVTEGASGVGGSGGNSEGAGGNCGALPAISMCVQRQEAKVCVPLAVEAVAMLYKSTRVSRLYDILIESLCRSLRLFEHSMVEHLDESETMQLKVPRCYHFFPQEFGHFLSCSYLDGLADDDSFMQDKRKRLHRHFGLPVTCPYFRRANRCIFQNMLSEADCDVVADGIDAIDSAEQPDMALVNVHRGLRASGVIDGKVYLVQGNYRYYHYLQQRMNDKGWGCAYRSLQTLCSWFLLQGYTEHAVPTHREIQQHLATIGDKPQSFVGSTQWIGSTEVSMCLQGFVGIDSKILHVSSGAELASVVTDLAVHFQTQGTPVMIGGGVLAHTIIGVDYSPMTGQSKFLVLDPHYTGDDELQTIQSKGWCGWKAVDFWDKRSYYNLCMPQRPILF